MPSSLGVTLLAWYRRKARDLPWRLRPNPYRVWLSEVLLQQTTVATAGPYFSRFVKRYPTVRSLAAAREEDVLALWSGLGYYHRARNLLKAARLIVERHRGSVPADHASLRALPGVGPYTAGAILSIGHNLPYPAVDSNVMRVVARLDAIEADPSRASTRRLIEERARGLIPEGEASSFNQALMDLGAMVCTPRRPSCGVCPLAPRCRALSNGSVDRIPPVRLSRKAREVELAALAVRRGDKVLLVKRGEGTLMKGLWEFPLLASPAPPLVEREAYRLGACVTRCAGRVLHTITDHRIAITVYEARPSRRARGGRPASAKRGNFAVSEPALRLATPLGRSDARWVKLPDMSARPGATVALTGSARKITRLLLAGSPPPAPSGAGRSR